MTDSPPTVPELLAVAVDSVGGSERPGQIAMAEAVANAFATGEHLAVQAGTGTGKSLAYLVPALRHAVTGGGTVVVSSHVMDLVQRMCDHVAVMDNGRVLAQGTVDQVRGEMSLEDRFVDLVGGRTDAGEGLSWLRPE